MKYSAVPILMYHDIGHYNSPWCITPQQFAAQMKFLQEQGYVTISLTELQAGLEQNLPLTQKAVVITFDDGREGVYTHALPILQQYHFTATIYIVPSWVDGDAIPPEEAYSAFLTWDQARELSAAGFEIGSHSFTHANLTTLSESDGLHQLQRAEEVIQQQIQREVHHFSYPYGAYNGTVLPRITSRYSTAVTVDRGLSKLPGKFARQWILNTTSLVQFAQLLIPPRLSLTMIVKNEEKNLATCLASVQNLVDEIIIMDTGSTDKTKEIAASFTNNIHDFTWVDDFAAARNAALRHATGDWVLILDADEVIAPEDHAVVQRAINNWDMAGYQILTRNYTFETSMSGWQASLPADSYAKSYPGWFPSLKVRLFQRQEGILFEGRIHEMVDLSMVRNKANVAALPVIVHHYSERANVDKRQYYLELSKKKVAENPGHVKAYFELGVLYKEAKQYVEAEKAFEESIRLDAAHSAPRLNLAIVQQKQGQYDTAIHNYGLVLEKGPNADAYFGVGFCYFQKNELDQAALYFQQAITQNPQLVDAYINLGAIYERRNQFQEGVRILLKAIAITPRNARAYYNLGVIYEKVGDLAKAMVSYEKAIELNYSRKAELVPKVAKMKEILEEDKLQ